MKKLLIAFGTRPEIIKLAPVILELRDSYELKLLHTGQHREIADPMLSLFGISPDVDLEIMKTNQDLFSLTSNLLPKLSKVLDEYQPEHVMVQGDTSTSFLTALAAFYKRIPVSHVEAGLRSYDKYSPFPEEMNRRQISQIAQLHFAPTSINRNALVKEGISKEKIFVTGNTVIDALNMIIGSDDFSKSSPSILSEIEKDEKLILLTAHRRENHGAPLIQIFKAVEELLATQPDLKVIFPIHPNPNVKAALDKSGLNNTRMIQTHPMEYLPFLHVLKRADLILTDSGGIQEEATVLGKPVLILRNETERRELIEAGLGEIVGTDISKIVSRSKALLESTINHSTSNIFGDGKAAEKIHEILKDQL
jgi:UDP-N-acetylglucosamine 2-epimerase (non-hydrolysing)